MLLVPVLRSAWLMVLGALPRTVLHRLDAWARGQADRRAQRRLARLQHLQATRRT